MCTFCSIKCCFIFFNSLFLASGIALITIGALQYTIYSQIGTFAVSGLSKVAVALIAVGVTIVITSIIGHVGAFFNSSSIVSTFICILIVIITLEVIAGAALYVFRSKTAIIQMNSGIGIKVRAVIKDYSPERRHGINSIQRKLRCCGADSYTDWFRSEGWENHDALPPSCCVANDEACGQDKKKVHTQSCISAITGFLFKNLLWVGAVCIALGVTEVFGVLVGVCLYLDMKRKNYENIT